MAMDNAQLEQLLRAVRGGGGGKKLRTFTGSAGAAGLGAEWVTWRSHFDTVRELNNWDDLVSRRQLKAAMDGEAARTVSDIDIEAAGRTINLVLTDYAARFLTPAGGQLARTEFHGARQEPHETERQFHSRVREMFIRAYPAQAANLNASELLIQTFALGLADTEVARYVMDRTPAQYTEALELATAKRATEHALKAHGKLRGGLHAIGSSGQATSAKCWNCGKGGHMQRDCTEPENRNNSYGGNSGRWRGRRGGRGRGGQGGGRGGRNNRHINSVGTDETAAATLTSETEVSSAASGNSQSGN